MEPQSKQRWQPCSGVAAPACTSPETANEELFLYPAHCGDVRDAVSVVHAMPTATHGACSQEHAHALQCLVGRQRASLIIVLAALRCLEPARATPAVSFLCDLDLLPLPQHKWSRCKTPSEQKSRRAADMEAETFRSYNAACPWHSHGHVVSWHGARNIPTLCQRVAGQAPLNTKHRQSTCVGIGPFAFVTG